MVWGVTIYHIFIQTYCNISLSITLAARLSGSSLCQLKLFIITDSASSL